MEELDFKKFVEAIQEYKLDKEIICASAHHSNGSGRDWEALQRELKSKRATSEE